MTGLATDRDLAPGDILQLASADAVPAFFANLGYDTSARLLGVELADVGSPSI